MARVISRRTRWFLIGIATLLGAVMWPIGPATGAADNAHQVLSTDFDGDGLDDLAIGVPKEDLGGAFDAGAVNVVYGSPSGLDAAAGDQFWHQDKPNVNDDTDRGDQFGRTLAHGDFDKDGFEDLAVGVPGETVTGNQAAGGVHILFGRGSGLGSGGDQFWTLASEGVKGDQSEGDRFGAALAAADFDGDGFDDLGVGIPGELIESEQAGVAPDAGAVTVLYGSGGGLSAAGDQRFIQGGPGDEPLKDASEEDDRFGWSLAAGRFGKGQRADLVIGVPGEPGDPAEFGAGAVQAIYGRSGGLDPATDEFLQQDDLAGGDNQSEGNDFMGGAMSGGDFDNDGFDEIAVGAPLEDLAGTDAGLVQVVPGSSGGLVESEAITLAQESIGQVSETDDEFGTSLIGGRFNAGRSADLAVGVPGEDGGQGAVDVVYGSGTGLDVATAQRFNQASGSISDDPEADDRFGFTMTAGNFGSGRRQDLAVGVPREDVEDQDAGAVDVLYGKDVGLSTTDVDFWHQDVLRDSTEPNDKFGVFFGPFCPMGEDELDPDEGP